MLRFSFLPAQDECARMPPVVSSDVANWMRLRERIAALLHLPPACHCSGHLLSPLPVSFCLSALATQQDAVLKSCVAQTMAKCEPGLAVKVQICEAFRDVILG